MKTRRISRNEAITYNGGGLDINNSTLNMYNSLVSDNAAASDGAGLWIANNSSAGVKKHDDRGQHGGALHRQDAAVYFANATFTNAVIWGNSGGQTDTQDQNLVYYGTTSGTPSYSSVQGWNGVLGGSNNNAGNPLFVNPLGGDYQLGTGSLCIDAGDNNATWDYLVDLAGMPGATASSIAVRLSTWPTTAQLT